MRDLIIIAVLCMIAQQSFAQDKIVKLNGETINCKITEIGVSTVKYQAEGEDFFRNLASSKVQDLLFESGKIENLNKRIIMQKESDWKKVQIVKTDSDVEGLKKGEEIKRSSPFFHRYGTRCRNVSRFGTLYWTQWNSYFYTRL